MVNQPACARVNHKQTIEIHINRYYNNKMIGRKIIHLINFLVKIRVYLSLLIAIYLTHLYLENQVALLNEQLENEKVEPTDLQHLAATEASKTSSGSEHVEKPKPFCDEIFRHKILNKKENLRTPIMQNIHNLINVTQHDLSDLLVNTGVKNGCWTPNNFCRVRQSLLILVPYRSRPAMVDKFLFYMHKFLQKQAREYCIILSEQADQGQFNRGKLLNAGYDWFYKNYPNFIRDNHLQAMNFLKPDCVIFHDIDLLPEDPKQLYACLGYAGLHQLDKYNRWGYKTQHIPGGFVSSGGVLSVSTWQYEKINGHPNRYWGWGWEDHEMAVRLRTYNVSNDRNAQSSRYVDSDYINQYFYDVNNPHKNMSITNSGGGGLGFYRNEFNGYYYQMSHGRGFTNSKANRIFYSRSQMKHIESPWGERFWMAVDGLNSNFYKVLGVEKYGGYVRLKLDIRNFIPEFHAVVVNDNKDYYHHQILSPDTIYRVLIENLKSRTPNFQEIVIGHNGAP